MSDNGALAARMKRYEAVTQTVLQPRSYAVLRVDGRAFHSWTKSAGCKRPYDQMLATVMDETAKALVKDISGSSLAYVQSDEISVIFSDLKKLDTQPWFGGEVQKIVSTSASTATAAFNFNWGESLSGHPAMFDARVFSVSEPIEVGNYLLWRQQDAVRNSISMLAQSHFSHKQLFGKNTDQMQEMLFTEHGVNWNDTDAGFKRGRMVTKQTVMRPALLGLHSPHGGLDLVARTEIQAEPAPRWDAVEWMTAACLDGRDVPVGEPV